MAVLVAYFAVVLSWGAYLISVHDWPNVTILGASLIASLFTCVLMLVNARENR